MHQMLRVYLMRDAAVFQSSYNDKLRAMYMYRAAAAIYDRRWETSPPPQSHSSRSNRDGPSQHAQGDIHATETDAWENGINGENLRARKENVRN